MNSRNRFYEYYQKVNSFIVCNNVAQVIEGNFNCDNESNVDGSSIIGCVFELKPLIPKYNRSFQRLRYLYGKK